MNKFYVSNVLYAVLNKHPREKSWKLIIILDLNKHSEKGYFFDFDKDTQGNLGWLTSPM